MSARSLAETLLGIIGLYFVVESLLYRLLYPVISALLTPEALTAGFTEEYASMNDTIIRTAILSCGAEIVVGVAVFLGRRRLAALLSSDTAEPMPPVDLNRLLTIGMCLIGVWFAAGALPGLATHFYYLATTEPNHGDLVYWLVQLLIGTVMAVSAPGIRTVLRWVRPLADGPA